jgi:CBS domain-containing protein
MRAADVMTTGVVTVSPDANIRDVAGVMLERRISAVPVVDAAGKLAGIISEGDVIHRHEADTERKGHWWHALTETVQDAARVYTRAHGRRARDVMTADVVTVTEETPLADVAALLDKHRIKRVPVVKGDKLVGVVSRSNLLQALLAAAPEDDTAAGISVDDTAIRAAIMNEIAANDLSETEINVVVSDGVASLWGAVESDLQRRAINVAAENAKGVKAVEDHLGLLPNNRWRGV